MTIVKKTIGNSVYQYEVKWDKTTKKQVWKYIGKISTNIKKIDVGNMFTNTEIVLIKEAYGIACKYRYGKARDALKLICDKIGIKL